MGDNEKTLASASARLGAENPTSEELTAAQAELAEKAHQIQELEGHLTELQEKMKMLDAEKTSEFKSMQVDLRSRISDLEKQLQQERESARKATAARRTSEKPAEVIEPKQTALAQKVKPSTENA